MNEDVRAWLDRYLVAWRSNEPDDIRALFAEDATYAYDPFEASPLSGREAIVESWLERRDEPGTWRFEGHPVVGADGIGIVQGTTRYSDGRVYANLWVIRFADDGRATSFTEWYMEPPADQA